MNIKEKIIALNLKRSLIHEKMIAPAKAAVNALNDEGKHNTARDLDVCLSELEVCDTEMKELISNNMEDTITALFGEWKS